MLSVKTVILALAASALALPIRREVPQGMFTRLRQVIGGVS
jgi:hypothetical protein